MERPEFSRPIHVTTWMGLVLTVVTIAAVFVVPPLKSAFLANIPFNGFILAVFALGILFNLAHLFGLRREVAWANGFAAGGPGVPQAARPRLLAPLAQRLAARQLEGRALPRDALQPLLDGVQIRLEAHRDISRYIVGALIFLGLLGTFWGLLVTVASVSEIIGGISGGGNAIETFEALKTQLDAPLGGMATSFSCSLFGLAGALVAGFVDLSSGHAQSRFFNELERWTASLADPATAIRDEPDLAALLARTVEQVERLSDRLEPRISTETPFPGEEPAGGYKTE